MAKAARDEYAEDKFAKPSHPNIKLELPQSLLTWYGCEQRSLPWRAPPGTIANPYHVWLSEIMLQQTTVKTVIPYFEKFIQIWPNIEALAASDREDVRRAWAGLGYYSRAKNLHLCAQYVAANLNGAFPIFAEELEKLPGIGPYTAAAIAAIAFGQTTTPVDGNIERVITRLYAVEEPLPPAKKQLRLLARDLTPQNRPGDYAQALMDLGATICTPKRPSCLLCPIQSYCQAHKQGMAGVLPYRVAKPPKPTRRGVAFFVLREDGKILLRQRPEGGLLGGMHEVPSTLWQEREGFGEKMALKSPPIKGAWSQIDGVVTHSFTHFHLQVKVFLLIAPQNASLTLWAGSDRCRWVCRRDIGNQALPSVMRKIIAHAAASYSAQICLHSSSDSTTDKRAQRCGLPSEA